MKQKQGRVGKTYPEATVQALRDQISELEADLAEAQAVATELADENEMLKDKIALQTGPAQKEARNAKMGG